MFRYLLGLIAFGALSLPAARAQYAEVEPNDTRAQAIAAGAFVMSAGSTITGVTTGNVVNATSPGLINSYDAHLIELAPLPLGIYRHRLSIGSSILRHSMSIGSSNYGETGTGFSVGGVQAISRPAELTWYGFGRSERLQINITGFTSANPALHTSEPYTLTLTTEPVAAQDIPGSFAAGEIVLSGAGLTSFDTEIHVFDGALREIFDYKNDDPFGTTSAAAHLVRPYAAGVYYIAIGRFNVISSYPSASGIPNDPLHYYPGSLGGERSRSRSILAFPGSILASSTAISPVPFSVTDATALSVPVAAAVGSRELAWYRMQVGASGCTSPAITSSPADLEVCFGNSVSLTTTATGTEPLSYQWYWNGSPIPGVGQAATLSIPVVDFSYAGSYTCTVTNPCGSATTTPALLHVHPAGPEITQQPAAQTLCVGEMASFTVAATGRMHSGLEYQWMKDGSPILGANSPTLSFVVSGLADGGSYLCRVNEPGCGHADSDAALLTVRNAAPTIALVGDAIVNLECGQGSYVELGASVSDDCDQGLQVTIGGDTVDPHQLGHYVVTYDAVDSLGNPAVRVERHVFVVDTTPPVLTTSLATSVLWSPQHEMVNVGLAVQASDHCSPQAAAENVTVEVWCDEIELPDTGDGTGRHSPDAKDIGAGTLRLRSERRGSSDGRIYVLLVRTQDASGNAAYAFPTVVCPSNQNQTALSVVQSQALSVSAQLIAVAGTTERAEDLESTLASLGFRKHGLEAENGPHQ